MGNAMDEELVEETVEAAEYDSAPFAGEYPEIAAR